jgi:hypothetical protein
MVIHDGNIRAVAIDCRDAGSFQSKANGTKIEIDGRRVRDLGLGRDCGGMVLSGAYVDDAASISR